MNEIQKGLLMMMSDFDSAMRQAGVDYYLDGGTAIGAVRHSGFIPWDDDIDVVINKDDESRFIEAMSTLTDGRYFLQRPLSVDWPYLFYKLRLNGSTAIEEKYQDTRIHQGLFIDVFIADSYPDSRFRRGMYDLGMFYIHAVQTVCDGRLGKKWFDPFQKAIDLSIRAVCRILDMIPEKDSEYCCERMPWYRDLIKRCYLKDPIDADFEGKRFLLSPRYDEMLTDLFGDYMTPPPEEQRVPGHILAFSMDEDYTEWVERRKSRMNP